MTVPFVNKAFHIDDPAFLYAARGILEKPVEPYNFLIAVHDRELRFFENMPHPPLVPYLIALVMWITGRAHEAQIHLAFLPITILASVAMYFLARRFTSHPLASALLLITSPAFMVNSHQAMSDVPMLAFWLVAMACYIYGMDHFDTRWVIASVVFINLASMTKYPGILVLPILLLYSLIQKHSLGRVLMVVGSSLISLVLWSADNMLVFEKIHVLSILRQESYLPSLNPSHELSHYVSRMIEVMAHLGGAILVPIVLLFALRTRSYLLCLSIAVPLAVASSIFMARTYSLGYQVAFIFFVASGIGQVLWVVSVGGRALLKHVRSRARDSDDHKMMKDDVFVLVWIWLVGLYLVVIPPFSAARYVLPVLPPIVILTVNGVSRWREANKRWMSRVWSMTILLTLAVSSVVAIADYRLASVYREFGRYVGSMYMARGARVWVDGFWGFRYYLEAKGARPLRSREVAPGDIVVTSSMATLFPLPPEIDRKKSVVEEVPYGDRFRVRSFNGEAHAGFYSDGWGLLPYSYSGSELDRLLIYRVGGMADTGNAGAR